MFLESNRMYHWLGLEVSSAFVFYAYEGLGVSVAFYFRGRSFLSVFPGQKGVCSKNSFLAGDL